MTSQLKLKMKRKYYVDVNASAHLPSGINKKV